MSISKISLSIAVKLLFEKSFAIFKKGEKEKHDLEIKKKLNLTTNFEGVKNPTDTQTHTTVHFMTNCQQGADEISTSYFYHHINTF